MWHEGLAVSVANQYFVSGMAFVPESEKKNKVRDVSMLLQFHLPLRCMAFVPSEAGR